MGEGLTSTHLSGKQWGGLDRYFPFGSKAERGRWLDGHPPIRKAGGGLTGTRSLVRKRGGDLTGTPLWFESRRGAPPFGSKAGEGELDGHPLIRKAEGGALTGTSLSGKQGGGGLTGTPPLDGKLGGQVPTLWVESRGAGLDRYPPFGWKAGRGA